MQADAVGNNTPAPQTVAVVGLEPSLALWAVRSDLHSPDSHCYSVLQGGLVRTLGRELKVGKAGRASPVRVDPAQEQQER